MIYVVMEIYLLYPYAKSIGVLFDMANIWNMKVIQSNTNNEKAIISIPEDKFRMIFGKEPGIEQFDVPLGTESFMTNINVLRIEIR